MSNHADTTSPTTGGWLVIKRLAALIWKELRLILKDPRSRFSIIVPPIVQLVVFGYAATFEVERLPLAILDQSHSPQSRALIAHFENGPSFHRLATVDDYASLEELIDRQRVRVGIAIGPDFARSLESGRPAPVQVIADGRNSNTSAVALGYAARIVADFNRSRESAVNEVVTGRAVLVDRAWFNPNYLSRWFFVPAIVVELVLLEVLLLSALSVSREREQGTFDQLLVSPYRTWELLVGKAAPGVLLGLGQAVLSVVVSVYWFHVPFRGSLVALAIGLLAFVMSATGVGLFISSLARTMQQSLLGTFLFLMPAVLLSGLTTSVEDMPKWVRMLTVVNPLKYALHIGRDVFLRGATLADLSFDLLALLIIGAITLSIAGMMFRLRAQ